MPSPFPGMDPYLEAADIWPGFHAHLAVELQRRLNQQLSPRYYADVEIRSTLDDVDIEIAHTIRPDVSVFESLDSSPQSLPQTTAVVAIPPAPIIRPAPLSIRLRAVHVYRTQGRELVTTIELLSPYNKRQASVGLIEYRRKRGHILASNVHLVELDLLRGGERPALELADDPLDTDYVLLVNRYGPARMSEIWPVALNEALPLIPIPLLAPDPDVPIDLNAAIREVYAASRYGMRIMYQLPIPPPPIRPVMEPWVKTLLEAPGAPST